MDKEGEPLAHITMITVTGKLDITTLPVNEKKEKGMCKLFTFYMMVCLVTDIASYACSCRWCTPVTSSSCMYCCLQCGLPKTTKKQEAGHQTAP